MGDFTVDVGRVPAPARAIPITGIAVFKATETWQQNRSSSNGSSYETLILLCKPYIKPHMKPEPLYKTRPQEPQPDVVMRGLVKPQP